MSARDLDIGTRALVIAVLPLAALSWRGERATVNLGQAVAEARALDVDHLRHPVELRRGVRLAGAGADVEKAFISKQ